MDKKFNPEEYGMTICPYCESHGYIQNPNRQCCPKCGGFGFTRKEGNTFNQQDKPISTTDSGGQ